MSDNRIDMSTDEQKQVMLEILTKFAEYCDQHDLSYFLDAGTLLGAVRHKGYIPWDDDVDVCMRRQDYDMFIRSIKDNNGYLYPHLRVEFPENTVYPFLKIVDDRTILIEFPDRFPMEGSVYIDVFPKDGIKDKSFVSKCICKFSEFLKLIHWFNNFSIHAWKNSHSILKRAISCIGRHVIFSPGWAIKAQNTFIHWNAALHPYDECAYVTTLTNGEYVNLAPIECFRDSVFLDFEGRKFKAPIGYDEYLPCLYPGDYMQLPPVEQRRVHTTLAFWKNESSREGFLQEIVEKE